MMYPSDTMTTTSTNIKCETERAQFVVVGGGIAGVSCAEALAILEPDQSTVLISASPLIKVVTNVQPLSKYLVRFDVDERAAHTLTDRHPAVRVLNDSVAQWHHEDYELITTSGRRVRYDKLCICTGAQPKPIEEGHPHILTIRDTESARRLQERVCGARRILVVGNGGIATELVYELRGVEVVWAVKDSHISAAFVDAGAAEFLLPSAAADSAEVDGVAGKAVVKRMRYTETEASGGGHGAALGPDWHTRLDLQGVRDRRSLDVQFSCEVQKLLPGDADWPVYVELTNGKTIACDVVVSATGVIPNVEVFSKDTPGLTLASDGGILVDDHMRTSLKDVYAAGDACTAGWEHAKHWFQMRLWTQARQMGTYAARCMQADRNDQPILQDFCFELFTHVTRFFGHKVVLLGLHGGQKLGQDYELLLRATRGREYVKLVVQNGRVQGAVLVGDTDLEETCENLILDQVDVSHLGEDLLNPDVDIEDYFD